MAKVKGNWANKDAHETKLGEKEKEDRSKNGQYERWIKIDRRRKYKREIKEDMGKRKWRCSKRKRGKI